MLTATQKRFEAFAKAFVRKYWETVKSGAFPMPGNEPVEESVEELLSEVSYQSEFSPVSSRGEPRFSLRMTNTHGDWWLFTFQDNNKVWVLVGASADSGTETPHDLLGPDYSQYFEPFIYHVTEVANVWKNI